MLLVATGLVMAAMMVASAMPAFAVPDHRIYGHCQKAISKGLLEGFSHSEFNEAYKPWNSEGNQDGGRARCLVL
jgi:hypothetical protein